MHRNNLGKNVAVIALSALLFGSISGVAMVGVGRAAQFVEQQSVASAENTTPGASVNGQSSDNVSGGSSTANNNSGSNTNGSAIKTAATTGATKSVSEIAQSSMPQVVSITNTIRYKQYGYSMFGNGGETEAAASGSGVIVGKTDSEIIIATNHHVIEDSTSLSVQFVDGTSADAEIKGEDADADIAVIAVKLSDVSSDTLSSIEIAEFGDSDALQVGDQVVAIGNALGYGQSVTTGIISAKDRDVETSTGTETGLLQTDAAINPGNSGGALLNMEGQLIGINVAKYSSTDVEGMGYSIPSNKAKEIINTLASKTTRSKVSQDVRGYLGIQAKTIDSATAEAYGMVQGVYVYKIVEGSAAANSDLQEKDIIVKFDDQSVTSLDDMQELLDRYAAGETIKLTVKRPNGSTYDEKEINITLTSNPDNSSKSNSSDSDVFGNQNKDQGAIDFRDFIQGLPQFYMN
ncbi:S1C family serine protease [Oribacterium sp. WCC10]|uniref:S1C family serine protease n=1 Tax=Oribacterium sp. WCC10 TaxID=1855343 RepID=UPI0008F334F2|nr:trypsin-like peptidase domain-containing protein [Oribacterium sp. WCC10]SFG73545.1 serine protease Do [Oribacterium sp. WCC10]